MEEDHKGRGLVLRLDQESKSLLATVTPDIDTCPIDEAWLTEHLAEQGYAALRYEPNALLAVLANYNAGTVLEIKLAEAVDASLSIDISEEGVEAYLNIQPPAGGAPVTSDAVFALLADNGIGDGVLPDAIAGAVATGVAEGLVIARGLSPEHGLDGRLESLIPDVRSRVPQVDDTGHTDYRDLGDIFVVHAGDWLMLRHPPTPGEPGKSLLGEKIEAVPGKPVVYASSLPGTAFDPANPDLLIAAITGQPVVVKGGMMVEPIFKVDVVGTASGNIDFDGSVVIKGDVNAGMRVKVSGDIEVGGVVDMGTLEAGGSIVVKGGVMGSLGRKTSEECHIHCGGSLHAAYAQQATIEAGDSIFIDDTAMQCDLTAINHIHVAGKRRGHIIGGHTHATLSITAKVIGSPNRVLTHCEIGVNPLMHKQLLQMNKQRDDRETQLLEISKLLDFASKNPGRLRPEMHEKARTTAALLSAEIAGMREEHDVLMKKIELSQHSRVVAQQFMLEGVEVLMGHQRFRVIGEQGACAVGIGHDGLQLLALDEKS